MTNCEACGCEINLGNVISLCCNSCGDAIGEAARVALEGSSADTAEALHRQDFSEVRLALVAAGEIGRWPAVREAVLAIYPGADI